MDAGFTCPNRDGKIGYGGCTYCYNQSFSPPTLKGKTSIHHQIQLGKKKGKFLVYFQPYTNTYADVRVLKKLYDSALKDDDALGLCVGTRPDCVPDDVLSLIQSYTEKYDVWIEYGLQSAHNKTLKLINRGHSFAQFEDAIYRTKERGILICVHVILGLPFETREDMLETIRILSALPIEGVKIHHLQVIENTNIAEDYRDGKFDTFSFDEYLSLIVDVIELLPPDIVVHRLVGDVLNSNILISPKWELPKQKILSLIERELIRRASYQGISYQSSKSSSLDSPPRHQDTKFFCSL